MVKQLEALLGKIVTVCPGEFGMTGELVRAFSGYAVRIGVSFEYVFFNLSHVRSIDGDTVYLKEVK